MHTLQRHGRVKLLPVRGQPEQGPRTGVRRRHRSARGARYPMPVWHHVPQVWLRKGRCCHAFGTRQAGHRHSLCPLPSLAPQIHSSAPGRLANNSNGGDLATTAGVPSSVADLAASSKLTKLSALVDDPEFQVWSVRLFVCCLTVIWQHQVAFIPVSRIWPPTSLSHQAVCSAGNIQKASFRRRPSVHAVPISASPFCNAEIGTLSWEIMMQVVIFVSKHTSGCSAGVEPEALDQWLHVLQPAWP